MESYVYDEREDASVPFATLEAARKCLLKDAREYDQDEVNWKGYAIPKWIPGPGGEMLKVIKWHLSKGGAIWFADINKDFDLY